MKIVIYRDKADEWRWKALAKNGRNIANGSEGYASRTNVWRAARRFIKLMRASDEPIALELEQ